MVWEALSGIGAAIGGASSLANTISQLIGTHKLSPQQKLEMRQWERMRTPSRETFQSIFYNPTMAGLTAPYSSGGYGADTGQYSWSPSKSLQNLYSNYLGRQYGIPDSIAKASAAQSLGPLSLPRLSIGNARQVSQAAGAPTGDEIAKALLASRAPGVARQSDILKSAADIAAFNLYRMQLLPQLIG